MGYSMVQLLISSMLGLLLSAAVLSTLYAAILSNRLRHATETVQENAALTEYFIARDMRAMGFKSCFKPPYQLINNVSKGIVGQHFDLFAKPLIITKAFQQSDLISFVTVLNGTTQLAGSMATLHAPLDLVNDNRIQKQQELLITNCEAADLVKVSSIWNNRLSHNFTANKESNLSENYQRGALIFPLSLVSYKLAKGASGRTGLFRKEGEGSYQELIPNVENFRIEVGVYSKPQKILKYFPAQSLAEISNPVSLRVYLLLSSTAPVLNKKMQYLHFSGDLVFAKDLRFYKAYSILIALRNAKYVLNQPAKRFAGE